MPTQRQIERRQFVADARQIIGQLRIWIAERGEIAAPFSDAEREWLGQVKNAMAELKKAIQEVKEEVQSDIAKRNRPPVEE